MTKGLGNFVPSSFVGQCGCVLLAAFGVSLAGLLTSEVDQLGPFVEHGHATVAVHTVEHAHPAAAADRIR